MEPDDHDERWQAEYRARSIDTCPHCEYLRERVARHRADLDMANARVAVLREGLEMLWRWQGAPDINDETTFSAVEFDRTYGNPEGDGWPAIRALLASPDDAAQKLLAWRDAAMAWKETYDAIQRAPVLSPQLIAEDFARERAFWAALSATGPGTQATIPASE